MLNFNDLKMLLREQEEERNQNAAELEQIKTERAKLQKQIDELKAEQLKKKTQAQAETDKAKAEILRIKAEILKETHKKKQTEVEKATRREKNAYTLIAIFNAVVILSAFVFYILLLTKY